MIPGPIEYEQSVIDAMSRPTLSHTSKEFISIFKETLEDLIKIFGAQNSLPFIVAGSGTLGMEISTLNFIKRDSKVLVISTGYFGDRFVELLSRFSKNVDVYKPPLGSPADPNDVYERVQSNDYDLVTITHVDTSTGVRNDIKEIAKHFKSLETILVVDGVCSIGGEEFHMDWGADVAFTASQKALGVPPGLTAGVVNEKALNVMKKNPPLSYFSDLRNWMNVFGSMLRLEPSYFGTPNVNLIVAMQESLRLILNEGMEKRVARHNVIAQSFRDAIKSIGLSMIPKGSFANTISVPYLPEGINQAEFLREAEKNGAVFAGGLLPEIKDRYFRIGHMGAISSSEVMISIGAIERALKKTGYNVRLGTGLSAAQEILYKYDMG